MAAAPTGLGRADCTHGWRSLVTQAQTASIIMESAGVVRRRSGQERLVSSGTNCLGEVPGRVLHHVADAAQLIGHVLQLLCVGRVGHVVALGDHEQLTVVNAARAEEQEAEPLEADRQLTGLQRA
eukprot:6819057-Pyramimonas_sp.AAC.1